MTTPFWKVVAAVSLLLVAGTPVRARTHRDLLQQAECPECIDEGPFAERGNEFGCEKQLGWDKCDTPWMRLNNWFVLQPRCTLAALWRPHDQVSTPLDIYTCNHHVCCTTFASVYVETL